MGLVLSWVLLPPMNSPSVGYRPARSTSSRFHRRTKQSHQFRISKICQLSGRVPPARYTPVLPTPLRPPLPQRGFCASGCAQRLCHPANEPQLDFPEPPIAQTRLSAAYSGQRATRQRACLAFPALTPIGILFPKVRRNDQLPADQLKHGALILCAMRLNQIREFVGRRVV